MGTLFGIIRPIQAMQSSHNYEISCSFVLYGKFFIPNGKRKLQLCNFAIL